MSCSPPNSTALPSHLGEMSSRTEGAGLSFYPIFPNTAFQSGPFGMTNRHFPWLNFSHLSPIMRFSAGSSLLRCDIVPHQQVPAIRAAFEQAEGHFLVMVDDGVFTDPVEGGPEFSLAQGHPRYLPNCTPAPALPVKENQPPVKSRAGGDLKESGHY